MSEHLLSLSRSTSSTVSRGLTTRSTIMPLQIWDTPSNFELDQLEVPLGSFSTIVYVMDMQVSKNLRSECE